MRVVDETLPLNELLAALASDHISPGSGTAAAAAMAFAAACAAKALAISRKHRDPDDVALAAQAQLQRFLAKSLQRAEVDSVRFEDFLRRKNRETAAALLAADQETQALAADLRTVLDRIEPLVHTVVAGDLFAARSLLDAATLIQARICEETQRAAAALV